MARREATVRPLNRHVFWAWAMAILVLSIISSIRTQAASRCEEARARDKRVGVEITNLRVVTALKETIRVSGLKSPVVICELHMPYVNATVDNFGHFYSVAITRMLIERSTDAELRAILGHEIAHIKLGHREPRFELTSHRRPETEQAADELSVRWFGKEAMLGVLKKLRADAERLHDALFRQRATAELDARIKAVH